MSKIFILKYIINIIYSITVFIIFLYALLHYHIFIIMLYNFSINIRISEYIYENRHCLFYTIYKIYYKIFTKLKEISFTFRLLADYLRFEETRESHRKHAWSLETILSSLRVGINYAYNRALHSTLFCTGCNLTGTFGSCFARDEEDGEDDSVARKGEARSRRRTRRTKKRAAEENEET